MRYTLRITSNPTGPGNVYRTELAHRRYCLMQSDAWKAVASRCPFGSRGYRVAVSRAGVWASKAARAYL